jgi:hypothetical protein
MTLRSKFDGQKILVPRELIGHAPCDVQIILMENERKAAVRARPSMWDVVARSRGTLDPRTILRETSADRDGWENA